MSDPVYWFYEDRHRVPAMRPVRLMYHEWLGNYYLEYGDDRVEDIGWGDGGQFSPQVYDIIAEEWVTTPIRLFRHEVGRLLEHCKQQIDTVAKFNMEFRNE